MIYGIFHPGSGLGNQLHRYVATRVLALEKGYDFSMINPEGFKGKDFMKLDMGEPNGVGFHIEDGTGKLIPDTWYPRTVPPTSWEEWDKHVYDPDFNFVEDNTIIDGNFEDERYFKDYLPEISKWLETKEWNIPDDVCVIGFRGGEFYTVPELGLPHEYFMRAIEEMTKLGIKKFEVHTDDEIMAKQWFSGLGFNVIRNIDLNWRAFRYAKYAIIPNSSFHILPRLLNGGLTIAPRYFNRYNVKRWDYPQSYYKAFKYI